MSGSAARPSSSGASVTVLHLGQGRMATQCMLGAMRWWEIWLALALSLTGLALMVQLWSGVKLNGLGVTFALIAAVIFAAYLLLAEREVAHRDSISLMAWGFPNSSCI